MTVTYEYVDSRYRLIERIGEGGMGIIFRAKDLITGQDVALKRVTLSSERLVFTTKHSTSNFRLALAQEFRMLSSLRHPHIISVLDYGFDAERLPYYTMDLLQDTQNIVKYGQDLPRKEQIQLLIQVTQALAYLHRRDIIHRDLKPENVQVANAVVKVLDFGLAVHANHIIEKQDGRISGTLGYMAPEVLMGLPASEASDLYALGVIAYEMLYGRHPFNIEDPAQLVQEVIYSDVDYDGVDMDTVDMDLQDILKTLLEKSPEDRYKQARDVINVLANYIDAPQYTETATIRDSYIQAANFVGRDKEMAQLEVALRQIMPGGDAEPTGSGWLIGGESGVGKSRLVEEVRTLALVAGALVLWGQSVDGGVPFQMWRNIVRRLVLSTDMDNFDLGVLRDVAPDIADLVGRDIPKVPEISERASVQRLASTITTLFKEQSKPVVLLLEDLHWADESLDILQHLLGTIKQLPLFIIGTYRNEEMPELPDILPQMHDLTLDRLSTQEIQALSVSILGERVGRQQNVLNLLQRETEGNVFFLVEVVRVLAEEAGKLSNIGAVTLPDSVFSGSMRTVIERRLSRLPIDALPMLRLAAVYGRELDLTVLRHIDPFLNFDNWLLMCSNVAILEAVGDTWRFAHDRMRDGVLDVLDPSQRPKLNRMIAEAIEDVYPDDDSYALRLMRHWAAADNPDKEARYARLAGIQAFGVSDYREALALFSRAAAITGGDTAAQIFVYQGEVHYRLGNYKAAQASLNMALQRNPTDDEQTRVLSILADVAAEMGNYDEARDTLLKARQFTQTANVSAAVHARVLSSLGEVNWRLGEISDSSEALYEADGIAREAEDVDLQLKILNRIATMAFYRQEIADAEEVLEEAYFAAIAANHSEQAMVLINTLGIVARAKKDFTKAETRFLSAIEFAHKLRLQQHLAPYMVNLATVRIMRGQATAASHDLREAIGRAMANQRTPQVLLAVAGFALLAHHEGDSLRARVLSGLVLNHDACDHALHLDVERRLKAWGISPEAAKAAAEGKDFDMIVNDLMIG